MLDAAKRVKVKDCKVKANRVKDCKKIQNI